MKLDYPSELKNIEELSKVAKVVLGDTAGIKDDLELIARASVEMVSVSRGLVVAAETDAKQAVEFIGLLTMGCYWQGYHRALRDIGMERGSRLM